ncbi:MAG: M24 family metallopeptidase [candidate division Zixibacteria bacterium]|nr:M24 family metallopeptidase [candidate division Zixibacteria bacterium]
MTDRVKLVRKKMKELGVDSFITATPANADPNQAGTHGWANVNWLTGYTGTNGIAVVAKRSAYFITDFRYTEQAKKQTKDSGFSLRIAERDLYGELAEIKSSAFGKKVGIESENITVSIRKKLRKYLKNKKLVETEGAFSELRAVKDRSEVYHLRQATKITDESLQEVLQLVKPGIRELDLAVELEYRFRSKGGFIAFDTIVASGWRGALPHGKASTKKIRKGEMITFDIGASYKGYCADLTRTVVLGKANKKQKEVYNTVLQAQLAAIDAIKPGAHGKEVDRIARDYIDDAGYGEYFGHGLGHGIGLIVHDTPVLSPKSDWTLKEGMVTTVEPGIYIPNWGGIRIEDDVVVTSKGCSILNKSPKELIEL